ncbi:hypothetical protein KIPB_005846, partial [Kipferlia bialata]
ATGSNPHSDLASILEAVRQSRDSPGRFDTGGKLSGCLNTLELLPTHHVRCYFIHIEKQPADIRRVVKYLQTQPVLGVDFEWRPAFQRGQFSPISVIQLATLRESFVLHVTPGSSMDIANRSPLFSDLLDRAGQHGQPLYLIKGPQADKAEYLKSFGKPLLESVDIHPYMTQLRYGSLQMGVVAEGLGCGSATPKSRKVSMSNWAQWPLTKQQCLYAAFDAFFNVFTFAGALPFIQAKMPASASVGDGGMFTAKRLRAVQATLDRVSLLPESVAGVGVTDCTGRKVPRRCLDTMTANEHVCPFLCPLCQAKFGSLPPLLAHTSLYHPTRPLKALQIDRVFVLALPASKKALSAYERGAQPVYSIPYLLEKVGIPLSSNKAQRKQELTLARKCLHSHWYTPDIEDRLRVHMV